MQERWSHQDVIEAHAVIDLYADLDAEQERLRKKREAAAKR